MYPVASLPRIAPTPEKPQPQLVRVVDFDMPMRSMMNFMVKWAIASIPAMILLTFVGGFLFILITGLIAVASLSQ
jgi:hypothetical protein